MGLLLRGGKGREGKGEREGKEGKRKREGGKRGKGGEGKRDGTESLGGQGARDGEGVGKRGGEGKFRGARPPPPKCFFPRTAPAYRVLQPSHNIITTVVWRLTVL